MKAPAMFAVTLGVLAVLAPPALAEEASPVAKVVHLLSDLHAKVTKEGEQAKKTFEEYSEWCEDRTRDLTHDLKTATSEADGLKATIAEKEATGQSLQAK